MIRAARAALIVSLALWVGGLATISFVVAPTAFREERPAAGKIVGASLRSFGKVELTCGVLALGSSLLLYSRRPSGTQQGRIRTALIFLMLAVTASYVFWVYPDAHLTRLKLDSMPNDSITKDHFSLIHRISVILVSVNILLGSGVLIFAAAAKPSDGA
jgi:uncharacterized membrane protein